MGDGRKTLYLLLPLAVWSAMLCIGCGGSISGNLNGGGQDNGGSTSPVDPNPRVTLGAYPSSGAAPLSVGIDASGSYARDLRPLTFSFDCDGDGTFEVTTDKSNMVHVFSLKGTYRVKVKVTDKSGRSSEATVVVTVTGGGGGGGGGGQNPTVRLDTYQTTGVAPHTAILDASWSWAWDYKPLSYEFDFDGDGDYDLATSQATVTHTYTEAGVFTPKVRGTDTQGRSSTDTGLPITVTAGAPNQAPHAVLLANPQTGYAPLVVQLDASASWDIDGTIARYDWDFDGDGTYEQLNGGAIPATRTFTAGGTHLVFVRVTDDDGAAGAISVAITVLGSGTNQPPVARLSACPTSGAPPLTVTFDPWESSDPEEYIARFLFDYNGDGTIDMDYDNGPPWPFRPPDFTYTYDADGTYSARLTVRDTQGAEDTTVVVITVGGGGPPPGGPVAILAADPAAGAPPLTVTFYAGYSYSTGSAIETFDWDMEGDGTFELLDAGPEQQRTYTAAGTYAAAIRVTDYRGLQATAEAGVFVSGTT